MSVLYSVCLQELLEVVDEVNGRFLVTSDHGNADEMVQVWRWLRGGQWDD